jgi:molybdopterin synthase catalytic subunit
MAESESVLSEENVHVQLTDKPLDMLYMMQLVKRDDAGAVVTFTGGLLATCRLC